MAVLPTPGSPISTGLFLVRRESTCTVRRISSSRPITGSSLPSRATSVRSRAYLFNASYRSEEHTSELQSLMRISYAVFCLKKKNLHPQTTTTTIYQYNIANQNHNT